MRSDISKALLNSVAADPEGWQTRSRGAARRLLTAVCFRETADTAFHKAGSVLLPAIGFYYAMFHMGVAALWVDYRTKPDQLRRMPHARLRNLVKASLVDANRLPASFLALLARLRKAREYANYVLGGKMKDDFIVPIMRDDGASLYPSTGKEFAHALSFIRRVSATACGVVDISARIAATIGDDIGDDVYSMYLSTPDKKRVIEYLVSKDLTT